MKILILTKRQTTNNDVIDNKFGRSWEFPLELAKLSNEVYGFCLSYTNKTEGPVACNNDLEDNLVSWNSINVGNVKPLGFIRYSKEALNLAKEFNPDIILAMSDSIYAILGCWIARRLNKLCFIDLQDNYEAYDSNQIPYVPKLFKRAVKEAHGVLCVSDLLKEYITKYYSRSKNTFVIENGISNNKFHPINRNLCRNKLNLPVDAKIIGMAGSLFSDRGIKVIFDGFEKLKNKYNNLHLAVVGSRNVEIPKTDNIHDLNVLPHNEVKFFINALDTAIICNTDSLQYTYGFPVKAFETIACNTPMVVSKVGPLMKYFDRYSECFFCTNDVDSFCKAIEYQLSNQKLFDVKVNTWEELSKDIDSCLRTLLNEAQ